MLTITYYVFNTTREQQTKWVTEVATVDEPDQVPTGVLESVGAETGDEIDILWDITQDGHFVESGSYWVTYGAELAQILGGEHAQIPRHRCCSQLD
jgi:hypothetical protein